MRSNYSLLIYWDSLLLGIVSPLGGCGLSGERGREDGDLRELSLLIPITSTSVDNNTTVMKHAVLVSGDGQLQ